MSTVSAVLIIVLIFMEGLSIFTHIFLFIKKRNAIVRHTAITRAIREEMAFARLDKDEIDELKKQLTEIKNLLVKNKDP